MDSLHGFVSEKKQVKSKVREGWTDLSLEKKKGLDDRGGDNGRKNDRTTLIGNTTIEGDGLKKNSSH